MPDMVKIGRRIVPVFSNMQNVAILRYYFVTTFLLLGQRAIICLFRCLTCIWAFVYFSCVRLSKHLSAVHSVVIVSAGDIRLLFKLQLKFRNVLKH